MAQAAGGQAEHRADEKCVNSILHNVDLFDVSCLISTVVILCWRGKTNNQANAESDCGPLPQYRPGESPGIGLRASGCCLQLCQGSVRVSWPLLRNLRIMPNASKQKAEPVNTPKIATGSGEHGTEKATGPKMTAV